MRQVGGRQRVTALPLSAVIHNNKVCGGGGYSLGNFRETVAGVRVKREVDQNGGNCGKLAYDLVVGLIWRGCTSRTVSAPAAAWSELGYGAGRRAHGAGGRLPTHLVEVVVAQTVGKIQVRWISWNRIPTSSRIKSYIHGVSVCVSGARSCSCSPLHGAQFVSAVYNPGAQGRRRRGTGGEADPGFFSLFERG